MDKQEFQVINIFFKDKKIENLRKEYDKNYSKFKTHLTLVYPFKDINKKELEKHIKTSLINKFEITFESLGKSKKGNYLYLLANKNKNKILKLYQNLNSGILSGFENKEMPKFIPHISLGKFDSKKELESAFSKLNKKRLNFKSLITEINLLTLDKNHNLKQIKKFNLK